MQLTEDQTKTTFTLLESLVFPIKLKDWKINERDQSGNIYRSYSIVLLPEYELCVAVSLYNYEIYLKRRIDSHYWIQDIRPLPYSFNLNTKLNSRDVTLCLIPHIKLVDLSDKFVYTIYSEVTEQSINNYILYKFINEGAKAMKRDKEE